MLDRLLLHRSSIEPDPGAVVPEHAEHQRTLERADALLDDPRVGQILAQRQRLMRASFARADRRLSR